ncbi:hypothetical protein JCGZ_14262 [Jatropha curcas]|uniref:Uncharacterized protein n=1 Tax=Jatropha curcas TaxID=180498 RepID=A0A067JWZ2_JATCU|nr:hypothetical protein JCGZ_14262 [Jatropha curcas]
MPAQHNTCPLNVTTSAQLASWGDKPAVRIYHLSKHITCQLSGFATSANITIASCQDCYLSVHILPAVEVRQLNIHILPAVEVHQLSTDVNSPAVTKCQHMVHVIWQLSACQPGEHVNGQQLSLLSGLPNHHTRHLPHVRIANSASMSSTSCPYMPTQCTYDLPAVSTPTHCPRHQPITDTNSVYMSSASCQTHHYNFHIST